MKTIHFTVDAVLRQGQSCYPVRSNLKVDIQGESEFLGLVLSTTSYRDSTELTSSSRTSTAPPAPGQGNQGELRRYSHLVVNTYRDDDPHAAASKALHGHLWGWTVEHFGEQVAEVIKEDPGYRDHYQDLVVEPLSVAILGLCRDPRLLDLAEEGAKYWTIGTWTLAGIVEPNALSTAISKGFLVQDVLVVRDNDRGFIKGMLL